MGYVSDRNVLYSIFGRERLDKLLRPRSRIPVGVQESYERRGTDCHGNTEQQKQLDRIHRRHRRLNQMWQERNLLSPLWRIGNRNGASRTSDLLVSLGGVTA